MDSYGGEHRPSLLDPSLLDDATPLAAARRETRVALASVQELTERVQELSKELAEARGIAKMCGHLLETTLRQFTRCAGTLEAVPANPEAASTEAQGGAEGAAASDSKGGDGSGASAAEGASTPLCCHAPRRPRGATSYAHLPVCPCAHRQGWRGY